MAYSDPNKRLLNSRYVPWNDKHIRTLNEILIQLKTLKTPEGALKVSTKNNDFGPYQTLEGLLPFLLFPDRNEFLCDIVQIANYILGSQDAKDGGFCPYPEYQYMSSAVDSTAYAIYVFAIFREFLYSLSFEERKSLEYSNLVSQTDNSIKRAIQFVHDNKNADHGWGFILDKSQQLPSRAYSTGLVIAALSYCRSGDFEGLQNDKRSLISGGTNYLLSRQRMAGEDNEGGWSFSATHDVAHPNITAFVIWAMNCTYNDTRDSRVESSIDRGIKYIIRSLRIDELEKVDEVVHFPASSRRSFAQHSFSCSYYMIVPAALLSGELGFKDDRLAKMVSKVENEWKEILRFLNDTPLQDNPELRIWELAETAYALISYYSVHNAVENCTRLFAGTNNLYRAIVQAEEDKRQAEEDKRQAEEDKKQVIAKTKKFRKMCVLATIVVVFIVFCVAFFPKVGPLFGVLFSAISTIIGTLVVGYFVNLTTPFIKDIWVNLRKHLPHKPR